LPISILKATSATDSELILNDERRSVPKAESAAQSVDQSAVASNPLLSFDREVVFRVLQLKVSHRQRKSRLPPSAVTQLCVSTTNEEFSLLLARKSP